MKHYITPKSTVVTVNGDKLMQDVSVFDSQAESGSVGLGKKYIDVWDEEENSEE